jgi:hypothetical protein
MGMDLLMPGAFVSNTTERSANASVVSASLALAAYPDEDDELELLDDELVDEELLEDELVEEELLDDELLEAEPLEDELLDDEPDVPPHPLSTMAKAASAKFKDFIFFAPNGLCSYWRIIPLHRMAHNLCFAMQFTSFASRKRRQNQPFSNKLRQRPGLTLISHTSF